MGLENRRSGNTSLGSNPSLSANSLANTEVSDTRTTRCSCAVPTVADGTQIGTLCADDWYWFHDWDCEFRCLFSADRFQSFLSRCGYLNGRPGIPPQLHFGDGVTEADWIKWGEGAKEFTYFARGKWSGRIKIGKSKQPAYRVSKLHHDRGPSEEAEMLVFRTMPEWERMYHDAFHPWRVEGEWFAPHPDILAEVARVRELLSWQD